MPAVPSWDFPTQFDLTNPYNTTLSFNVQTASGLYLLINDGCDFTEAVRSTSDNVPQADGGILHHRFITATQMSLKIGLFQDEDTIACDTLLAEMLDTLTGALRSLLNAGDNQGRLAWEISGGNERMLDDVRLLTYPSFVASPIPVVTAVIDSQYPYAQDLNQQSTTILDGASDVLDNTGTADYWPVYKVSNVASSFILSNTTTGEEIVYTGTIAGMNYAEIDSFKNTVFLNGNGADLLSNVDIASTLFPKLQIGANTITISGGDVTVLWAPAWG